MYPIFSIEMVAAALASLREDECIEFTTVELIARIFNYYRVDRGVPVCRSPNAAFGTCISRYREALRLELAQLKVRAEDIDGRRTTCARWTMMA